MSCFTTARRFAAPIIKRLPDRAEGDADRGKIGGKGEGLGWVDHPSRRWSFSCTPLFKKLSFSLGHIVRVRREMLLFVFCFMVEQYRTLSCIVSTLSLRALTMTSLEALHSAWCLVILST